MTVRPSLQVFSPPIGALLDVPPYADLVVTLLKCVKNISFQVSPTRPTNLLPYRYHRGLPFPVKATRYLPVEATRRLILPPASPCFCGNANVQENTLEKLEGANAIRLLVPLMDRRGHARDKEMENQILHCMYNLCRVNKRRQEKVRRPSLRLVVDRY